MKSFRNLLAPDSFRRRAGAVGLVAVLLSAMSVADDSPATARADGTWQFHKYSFQFMGFTSTYSCDGLADKLKELLLAAGARADVKSAPGACTREFGRPDRFARADLKFFTLTPLAPNAAAAPMPVSGTWRSVTFANHSPRNLQLGDCELVEQFRDQVLLKMFATRNVAGNTTCIPHQESGSVIDLRFESFVPVPAPGSGAAPAPGGSG